MNLDVVRDITALQSKLRLTIGQHNVHGNDDTIRKWRPQHASLISHALSALSRRLCVMDDH